jgi:hypothetical protein
MGLMTGTIHKLRKFQFLSCISNFQIREIVFQPPDALANSSIIHHVGQVWMPRSHQFRAIFALDIIPANELAEYEIANDARRSTTFAATSFQRTFSYRSFDHWIWLSIGCARCLSSLILPFLAGSLASSFAARYRSTERSGQIMHVPSRWPLLIVNTHRLPT